MNIYEEEQAKEQREAEKKKRLVFELSDFKSVLATAEGRRFIRRVIGECGVHQTSFNPDPLSMAFKEGRRSVGLWLQSLFVDCPDQYIQLLKEESNVRSSNSD